MIIIIKTLAAALAGYIIVLYLLFVGVAFCDAVSNQDLYMSLINTGEVWAILVALMAGIKP